MKDDNFGGGGDVGSGGGGSAGTSQDGIDEATAEAAKIAEEIEALRALPPQVRAARLQDVQETHLATLLRVVRRQSSDEPRPGQAAPAGAAAADGPSDDEAALVSAASFHAHQSSREHSFNLGVRRASSNTSQVSQWANCSVGPRRPHFRQR